VIAKSFARIHNANLINFGLLPLTFEDPSDYDGIEQSDELAVAGIIEGLSTGTLTARNLTRGNSFRVRVSLTDRERDILLDGGLLAHTRRTGIDASENGGPGA